MITPNSLVPIYAFSRIQAKPVLISAEDENIQRFSHETCESMKTIKTEIFEYNRLSTAYFVS
jgi:hypothetical protein